MSAPAHLSAASPAGQAAVLATPSSSRPATRKRGVTPSKAPADGASEAPLIAPLPPSRTPRRTADVPTSSANGDGGDVPLSHAKDASPALHGQQHQVKQKTTVVPSSRGSPLKQRTVKHTVHKEAHVVGRKKPKSIWDVTGHLFSRFFILLVLGAGLGTSFWNWKTRPTISQSDGLISTEVEKVEDFVARTTKWMQVQLEVVDKKIGQEVGGLRTELRSELESQQLQIATEVKNLQEKLDSVGASLDALYSGEGPLTKVEALALIKDVVDKRAAEGQGRVLSLDDVRAAARQVVLREVERHSADGLGRVDYALGSGGGKVIAHSEGYFLGRAVNWRDALNVLSGSGRRHPDADKILQPSFGEPGQCLPLKGTDVWVDISLRTTIRPDAISLEHVSKDTAYDVSSAPKDFRVFGWVESRRGVDRVQHPVTQRLLGEFQYDVGRASVQTFSLDEENVAGLLINTIRLHAYSNHGNPGLTCIYRVRVHGSDPSLSLTPFLEE